VKSAKEVERQLRDEQVFRLIGTRNRSG
jgi:hypothetical protein